MYRPVGNTSKGEETFTRICLWNVRVYRMTVKVFKDSKNAQKGSYRIYDKFIYLIHPMPVIKSY